MAALTADTVKYKVKQVNRTEGVVMHFPVAATTVIYKGGFVGLNAAGNLKMYASPTVGTSIVGGDRFVGIALEHIASQTAAGDKNCPVLVDGYFEGALASSTILNIGNSVYASDDNTVTKSPVGNKRIGSVTALNANGIVTVRMDGFVTSAGPIIYETSPIIPSAAANLVRIVHTTQNPGGLIIIGAWGYTTTGFGGAAVYTLQDSAATTTGVTFTAAATTATNDLIQSAATTLIQGATDGNLVTVPAGLAIDILVTTTTATGAAKFAVMAAPIL